MSAKSTIFVDLFTGLVAAVCMIGIGRTAYLIAQEPPEQKYTCQLERVLPDMQASQGNAYGFLYTLDGKPMMEQYSVGLVKNKKTGEKEPMILKNTARSDLKNLYIPTEVYYASAVGLDHDYANGFLTKLNSFLSSNSQFINRREARGNSVVTTLVSEGQREAYEQIQDFQDKARFSSLSVVCADGAVLVNVGSNCDAILDYDHTLYDYYLSEYANKDNVPQPQSKDKVLNDFGFGRVQHDKDGNVIRCEDAECVGSVFKVVTARILQQNDDQFSSEYSVYNNAFTDVDVVEFGGDDLPIGNHDRYSATYPRQIGLDEALMYSSNTYFLRHAQVLGLDTYMSELSNRFELDSILNIDSHSIPAMPYDNPDGVQRFEEKVTYGQEAILTTTRLASVINHAVSGEAHDMFAVAEVRTPNNELIYHHTPQPEIESLHMDVDLRTDILAAGLKRTFSYYVDTYPNAFSDFSNEMLYSGRILAKSGTATKGQTSENHCMVMCILDEQREHVVATAAIAVNDMDISYGNGLVNEGAMAARLLHVFEALGVISDEG